MDEAINDSPLVVCEDFDTGIKVELEYIGEGFDGDFDESDPTDQPLIRFRVFDFQNLSGRVEENSFFDSYCTQIPATMPLRLLHSFACEMVRRLGDDEFWKHLLAQWSWSTEGDVRRIHQVREDRKK
jgi:hypothetical protein